MMQKPVNWFALQANLCCILYARNTGRCRVNTAIEYGNHCRHWTSFQQIFAAAVIDNRNKLVMTLKKPPKLAPSYYKSQKYGNISRECYVFIYSKFMGAAIISLFLLFKKVSFHWEIIILVFFPKWFNVLTSGTF